MVGVTLYQIASPRPAQDPRKLSEPEFIAFYLSLEVGIWPVSSILHLKAGADFKTFFWPQKREKAFLRHQGFTWS